jgi:hypothetical protein
MTAMLLAQLGHGLGSRTFNPTIGEADGADDGGDSKKFNCDMA